MKGRMGLNRDAKKLNHFARDLRRNMTDAEKALWFLLRNRRFVDYKFRRQVQLGHYIADFICISARLIIEVDGSQHADNPKDIIRDQWLAEQGYRIRRVWNNDVLIRKTEVMDAIWHDLTNGDG